MSQRRRGQEEPVPASESPLIVFPSHLQELRFHRDSGAAKRHRLLYFHSISGRRSSRSIDQSRTTSSCPFGAPRQFVL